MMVGNDGREHCAKRLEEIAETIRNSDIRIVSMGVWVDTPPTILSFNGVTEIEVASDLVISVSLHGNIGGI